MDFDGFQKLIAACGAALGALLTPIGVIYVASINKRNRSTDENLSYLTEEVHRLEERLAKSEKQVNIEKSSGIRWYQNVIVWFNHAHEMRRHALDARQVAESMARLRDLPEPRWTNSIELPPLDSLTLVPPTNSDLSTEGKP